MTSDDKSYDLVFVTPASVVKEHKVVSTILPSAAGELSILADHISIFTLLKPGKVVLIGKEEKEIYYISGGMAEFQNNTLTILADTVSCVI